MHKIQLYIFCNVRNIISYIKSSDNSIGRVKYWSYFGCKFKSYSGHYKYKRIKISSSLISNITYNRCAEIW